MASEYAYKIVDHNYFPFTSLKCIVLFGSEMSQNVFLSTVYTVVSGMWKQVQLFDIIKSA